MGGVKLNIWLSLQIQKVLGMWYVLVPKSSSIAINV